jgi:hypothetical protein|tara:strand:+ start:290 stop:520 length:231 start_codon:yes stop_codon:yes gene_type:complete
MSHASREQTAAETRLCIIRSNLSVIVDDLASIIDSLPGNVCPDAEEALAKIESACGDNLWTAECSIIDEANYGDER